LQMRLRFLIACSDLEVCPVIYNRSRILSLMRYPSRFQLFHNSDTSMKLWLKPIKHGNNYQINKFGFNYKKPNSHKTPTGQVSLQ
jgi:hypothetical protein